MKLVKIMLLTGLILASTLYAGISEAVETKITVRAKAKDAKFIGSSMGGALITIRDSETGEILSKGLTEGSTGDTRLIILEPIARGRNIAVGSTAGYTATIDIDEPLLVRVEAAAPLGQRQSLVKASTELWVIPGKDIPGDGIIIEIPGFALDLLSPQAHSKQRLRDGRASIPIKANLVML